MKNGVLTGDTPKIEVKGDKQMTDKKLFTTIDEYISTFPGEIQAVLEKVRQAIHKAAPEAAEAMSYGIPTFTLNGKHVVFFAGWKHHLSLYPIPAGDEAFQQELSPYKRAKGTIQFPLNKPVPYDFVEKIVTLLMMENPEKER
ncbi:MAG: DUF1801 domain-containing protein [Ktedonobacteraceae bacterium]